MIKAALSAGVVAVLAVMLLVARAPQSAEAATLFVFNPSDSGFGTLRWAVDQANGNSSIDRIVVKTTVPITLYEPVQYTGSQTLMVQGDHALLYRVIQGTGPAPVAASHGCALFVSTGGADITFYQLVFRDSGCQGISVIAPSSAGEIVVTLNKTIIEDNTYNGVYLSDNHADVSYKLNVLSSFIRDNGVATDDEGDGVLVEESESGNITATCTGSSFTGNGGNGLDLDESGVGNVSLTATNCQFNDNGQNQSPEEEATATDDEEEVEVATGSSGDGLHVDENDAGDITTTLNTVVANGNEDDGINLDEEDDGKVTLTATGVTADWNDDEGLDVFEGDDDDGADGATVKLTNVRTWNNVGEGVEVDENDEGDLVLEVTGSSANFNGEDGYDIDEDDDGKLTAKFQTVVANGNGDDGFDLDEESAGAFSATIYGSTAQLNDDEAVEAEADGDTGTIAFGTSTLLGGIDLTNVNVIP